MTTSKEGKNHENNMVQLTDFYLFVTMNFHCESDDAAKNRQRVAE